MQKESYEKLAPDTSVLIDGILSAKLAKGEITVQEILIHEAVISELEHQANMNKAIGFLGIEEIQKLKKMSKEKNFTMQFLGRKPTAAEIAYAKRGEIDSLIRDLAHDEDATFYTADKIQARIASAKGTKQVYIEIEALTREMKLEKFFDATTMSVHLRENVKAKAKKGVPGNWKFEEVSKQELTRDDIQDISREIIEEAGIRRDGFIEIERPGSTIVQLGSFRIVVTKPPFSDGWEITAVRPIKKLKLEDYAMTEKLFKRISEAAEGILIAGAPGMGKSTFAQALAVYYALQGKIVKTIEAPRDLILPEEITQYAISHGDAREVHDVLLLSRPDYTLFDEMRNTADFELFADLRLAGIGLAGVVHATNPVDAIQRFIGRIELGVIPQVIDTVIFIKNGQIGKVLSLHMVVKVPAGMTEEDLARPVVTVTDFETGKLEHEIYTYGEETVVVPVKGDSAKTGMQKLAAASIENEFRKYAEQAKAEMVGEHKAIVHLPEQAISRAIGKQGENIERIEKKLGISIDVQELKPEESGKEVEYGAEISKNAVLLKLGGGMENKDIHIYIVDDYLLTAKAGKGGLIKIRKDNKIGKILVDAITAGEKVRIIA